MSTIIDETEDALIARIKELLNDRVRLVDYAPPDWDEDFIKRALRALPAVFVIFGGGRKQPGIGCVIDSQWTIVAATKHVQEAKQRARGDAREIGCYGILARLAPSLDGQCLFNTSKKNAREPIGTLTLESWDNDESLQYENVALMVQSITFRMPLEITTSPDDSDLVPFLRFGATYDVGQLPGAPPTTDTVNLPQ